MKQKALAKEVGLNVASSQIVEFNERKYDIPKNIEYPCFTKPLATIVGGKQLLRRCDNVAELRTVLDKASSFPNMRVLVEDFKTIDTEYAVLGFSNGHEAVIPGVIQILELAHGTHYGVAARGKIMPIDGFEEIIEKFKQFILKVGFIGVFDIDFYRSGQELYFGELNLRIGGSMYAVTKMGVNLPAMMVRTLIGENIDDMPRLVSKTAVYVNERMVRDDWYLGYISTSDYMRLVGSAELSFVQDEIDPAPQNEYSREFTIMRYKRPIRRVLKKMYYYARGRQCS